MPDRLLRPVSVAPRGATGHRAATRRRGRRVLGAFLGALLVGSTVGSTTAPTDAPAAARRYPMRVLSGWVPYWKRTTGPAGVAAMASLASSTSSFAYAATSATGIARLSSLDANGAIRSAAAAARIPLVPTVTDSTGTGKMAIILADPTQRAAHVERLVRLAVDGRFDGIDLDYESFAYRDGSSTWATTKPLWTQFVTELGAALHARAKLLFVTVPPTYNNSETRGSGYWVYNLVGIAPHVDRIRIMAYDWAYSRVGPNAPLSWTQKIVDYAAANLPVSKVELGVPLYGRDWVTGVSGTCPAGATTTGRVSIITSSALALAKKHGKTPTRGTHGEMVFSYTVPYYASTPTPSSTTTTTTDVVITDPVSTDPSIDDGSTTVPVTSEPPPTLLCSVTRTVYYPDAVSSQRKLEQALAKGLAGVVFFAVGYEESTHFRGLRSLALTVPKATGANPIGRWRITPGDPGTVRVRGWALDPETSLPIRIRVVVNGRTKAVALANTENTAVGAAYPGNGPFHGADVTVPLARGRYRVCVDGIGVGSGLSVRRLGCAYVRVTAPTTTTSTSATSSSTTSSSTTAPAAPTA